MVGIGVMSLEVVVIAITELSEAVGLEEEVERVRDDDPEEEEGEDDMAEKETGKRKARRV